MDPEDIAYITSISVLGVLLIIEQILPGIPIPPNSILELLTFLVKNHFTPVQALT